MISRLPRRLCEITSIGQPLTAIFVF